MATGGKLRDLTSAAAVRAALDEFRRLGRPAFLEKYGFHPSRRFFLVEDGVGYDSKPIAAAAYGHQHGRKSALHSDDFSGGAPTVGALGKLGFKVSDWTSSQLEAGAIYTREQLREMFEIEDATINTGVFRPKDRNSLWLFVTRDKTSDRTQYVDRFEGGLLYWQGQTAGRTDQAIVNHEAAGDELLIFYRNSKRSHPGAGFRFEGQFRYLSHSGAGPASFILQRSSAHEDVETPEDKFDPSSVEDARRKIWAQIKRRQGQPAFRRGLIRAYGGRCAMTGCAIEALLEAAHIHPYRGEKTILVVSPYNMQVELLKATLPAGARVGTVDKFQGQEAAVVLVSMATSSGDDLPRNIEFLYSRNRLNVAISRARCLAVIFANPRLLEIPCSTIAQMELVNGLCWGRRFAVAQAAGAKDPTV